MLNGEAHSVETQGVLVRIIDNSLSRLEIGQIIFLYIIMFSVWLNLC